MVQVANIFITHPAGIINHRFVTAVKDAIKGAMLFNLIVPLQCLENVVSIDVQVKGERRFTLLEIREVRFERELESPQAIAMRGRFRAGFGIKFVTRTIN